MTTAEELRKRIDGIRRNPDEDYDDVILGIINSAITALESIEKKCAKTSTELETESLRLAACGVAAMCNTEKSIREQGITQDNPYYSASYADVCRIVRSEMELRAALESLQAKYDEAEGRRWKYPTYLHCNKYATQEHMAEAFKDGFIAARETIAPLDSGKGGGVGG